jgi:hypothetical protein
VSGDFFSFFNVFSPASYLILLFLWGHAQIATSFVFSTLFNKQKAASSKTFLLTNVHSFSCELLYCIFDVHCWCLSELLLIPRQIRWSSILVYVVILVAFKYQCS